MAQTIWKYTLPAGLGVHTLSIPRATQTDGPYPMILSCQWQAGKISLWCLVDPDLPTNDIRFSVEGTGQNMMFPDLDYQYEVTPVGTVIAGGGFVWHVFQHYDPESESDEPEI